MCSHADTRSTTHVLRAMSLADELLADLEEAADEDEPECAAEENDYNPNADRDAMDVDVDATSIDRLAKLYNSAQVRIPSENAPKTQYRVLHTARPGKRSTRND